MQLLASSRVTSLAMLSWQRDALSFVRKTRARLAREQSRTLLHCGRFRNRRLDHCARASQSTQLQLLKPRISNSKLHLFTSFLPLEAACLCLGSPTRNYWRAICYQRWLVGGWRVFPSEFYAIFTRNSSITSIAQDFAHSVRIFRHFFFVV